MSLSKEQKEASIMEQAQVFASAWSLVGGKFGFGNAMEDAEEAKDELRRMVRALLSDATPQGEAHERMFRAAVASLAEISVALDIPEDEAATANGNELMLEAIQEQRQSFGNLLARIHRDGGHYVTEHGWEKAAEDAEAKVVQWLARDDATPQEPPAGYQLVMVPKLQPEDEPDWDECIRQAEVSTGLSVERHTLSIVIREVRRWLYGKQAVLQRLQASPPQPNGRVLPNPGSPEASAMLDSMLAEYNWPANTKNAARAGWEAANRWLRLQAPSPQAAQGEAQPVAWDVELDEWVRATGAVPHGGSWHFELLAMLERAAASTHPAPRGPLTQEKTDAVHFVPPVPMEASTWQPIETAPRDGTLVVLAECLETIRDDGTSGRRWVFATSYWREYLPGHGSGFGWIGRAPTHWMPLPPVPSRSQSGALKQDQPEPASTPSSTSGRSIKEDGNAI